MLNIYPDNAAQSHHTRVLVTLPEVTPVPQGAVDTHDTLLAARRLGEQTQMDRTANGLLDNTYLVPQLAERPVGIATFSSLNSLSKA